MLLLAKVATLPVPTSALLAPKDICSLAAPELANLVNLTVNPAVQQLSAILLTKNQD